MDIAVSGVGILTLVAVLDAVTHVKDKVETTKDKYMCPKFL